MTQAAIVPAALPSLIERLEESGGLSLGGAVRERLLQISPATCARLLKEHTQHRLKQPYIGRRVASDPSHRIALHTFAALGQLPVGHFEIDLVLPCGMTTGGFFLTTLVAVAIIVLGLIVCPFGVKAKNAWEGPWHVCGVKRPFRCWASIATTAASSSTTHLTHRVSGKVYGSPIAVLSQERSTSCRAA